MGCRKTIAEAVASLDPSDPVSFKVVEWMFANTDKRGCVVANEAKHAYADAVARRDKIKRKKGKR